MNERNIFNDSLWLDAFTMDIISDWIEYQRANNWRVTYENFMDWADELYSALDYNFEHREDEDEE